jgi:hypothetical protein
MHEKDRKYNGYTNYETWNLKLWADNDEPCYKLIQQAVDDCIENGGDVYDLANEIKDITHDQAPEMKTGFYSDIMIASIREVNFNEIAETLLKDREDDIKKMDAFDQIDHLEKRALLDAQMNGDE